jgi:hypothetical protein
MDLTSTTKLTPDSCSRSANSTIVLVEWPMVKKVFAMAPTDKRMTIGAASRRSGDFDIKSADCQRPAAISAK